MKNKLAMWSWVLPIIGIVLWFGSAPFEGGVVLLGFTLVFVASVIGLVFGIIAFRRVSKDSKLGGKGQAILGIVLNILLILYWVVVNLFSG